ncbi:MAG: right-handed parallel beta-helix repeat-containing protein [Akkermansiaceae bacterium]
MDRTSRNILSTAAFAWWTAVVVVPSALSQPGPRLDLYTIPNSTFYQQPVNESVIIVNDTSGTISILQGLIDSARANNSSSWIVINLQPAGRYLVSSTPLTLGSKMCVTGAGATLATGSTTVTATSLISIASGSSFISTSDITLDGQHADVRGIDALGVSRVNIDKITVRDTGRDGIFLQGTGAAAFDNEITISRCDISGASTSSGIHIQDATQAICMENASYNNRTGITVESSARCTLINNRCNYNSESGIDLPDADWSTVSNNLCVGNPSGISTNSSSERNLIVSNDIRASATGIALAGIGHVIYDNVFPSGVTVPLTTSGTNHQVITTGTALSASGQNYFRPPTSLFDHTESIMNGKTRVDLITAATTLSSIQLQYETARTADPNAVIVLYLTAPAITGDATLVLGANTCVIISGTVSLEPGITAISALNAGNVSVSGGTIDGGNFTGRNGMGFEGCFRVLIDHVNFRNFGDKNTRVANSDVITFSKGATPCIVSHCTLDGGAARGIWTRDATARFILTDNTISNMNMDGIDLDGFTSSSLAKFNRTRSNLRTGIFLEEGARHNQIIGNTCDNNGIAINLYSFAAGPTSYNSIISNTCDANGRGIRLGARSGFLTANNFCYNNSILNTSPTAALDSQGAGTENYWSQQHLAGNSIPIGSTTSAVFFNSPSTEASYPATSTYHHWQSNIDWSGGDSSATGDPNANGWCNLVEYALDLDPVHPVSWQDFPSATMDTGAPDGPWLVYTFRRNRNALDLAFRTFVSNNLTFWETINDDGEIMNPDPDGDGSAELRRLRIKAGPDEPRRFVRLGIQRK